MQIYLVAVGTKMPSYINEAVAEYQKRMPNLCPLEVIEVAALKRGKNADIPRILRDESIAIKQTIRQHVGERAKVVALDRRGQSIDTLELARQQQRWIDESQSVAIVIGGPEGLAADFIHDADAVWSLSKLTFAHPVVRLMLAEQLYRAWSINANLPYHRGE